MFVYTEPNKVVLGKLKTFYLIIEYINYYKVITLERFK